MTWDGSTTAKGVPSRVYLSSSELWSFASWACQPIIRILPPPSISRGYCIWLEAGLCFTQSLEINQRTRPAGDPIIATILNNLAMVDQGLGRLAEAEKLYRQVLEMRQKALPTGHPEIGDILNNLSMLLHLRGRSVEAEPMLRQSLEIARATLAPGHPDIAQTLSNLGAICVQQPPCRG